MNTWPILSSNYIGYSINTGNKVNTKLPQVSTVHIKSVLNTRFPQKERTEYPHNASLNIRNYLHSRAPDVVSICRMSLLGWWSSVCRITCIHVFSSSLKKDVLFVFTPICFVGCSCFINVICIVYWLPTHIQYHNMFLSFNSNTTVVISGARSTNLPENTPAFTPLFSGVRGAPYLFFCVVFCR